MKISIIVPCYNEEEALPLFYNEICKTADTFHKVNFEFIFVNDVRQCSNYIVLHVV